MAGVSVTALLLAGRRPGTDPLAAARGQTLKALIPVAGRAMVARVSDTLLACPEVAQILVATQDIQPIAAAVPGSQSLSVIRSGGTIAASIAAMLRDGIVPLPLLVTTADHALLRPETVAAFLHGAAGADAAVAVVERRVVERRFPNTRRTWLRFRGGAYTGANLFLLGTEAALPLVHAWAEVEQDRKKGWKLIARFGPLLLLGSLTRLLGIEAAGRIAGRRLGADLRIVTLADPLAAVDVDKPDDLALAEAVLAGRA